MKSKVNILSFGPEILGPIAIYAVSAILAFWVLPDADPILARGIIYDLVLLAPVFYLILIWRKPIPKISAVPVFMIGVLVALFVIPEELQQDLDLIKNIGIPLIELVVVGFIVLKTRSIIIAYNQQRSTRSDFLKILRESSTKVLGNERLGSVFSTEIAMIAYGLVFWGKSTPTSRQFTGYKENAFMATFIAILFVLLLETAVVHYLLLKWNTIIAWVILGLSIYSGLQLLGHIKAVRLRLTEVSDTDIEIKYGLFGEAKVPLDMIAGIEKSDKTPDDQNSFHKMALLGELEAHNIILHLKEPVEVLKAYGFKKKASTLLLYLDERDDFISKIK